MWNDYKHIDLSETPRTKKSCFLAGTPVSTEQGLQSIEEIKAGQRVYAYNRRTDRPELRRVTHTFTDAADIYLHIMTAKGIISATGLHRFWLPKESRWCMANSLQTGMDLLSRHGEHITVQGLKIVRGSVTTYDLEVEDLHNYYVGHDEILAHNRALNSKSVFYRADTINVRFYRLVDKNHHDATQYIGRTMQDVGVRISQHRRDPKKPWMRDPDSDIRLFEIEINGKYGPHKMNAYEIVAEMREISRLGGRQDKHPRGKLFSK